MSLPSVCLVGILSGFRRRSEGPTTEQSRISLSVMTKINRTQSDEVEIGEGVQARWDGMRQVGHCSLLCLKNLEYPCGRRKRASSNRDFANLYSSLAAILHNQTSPLNALSFSMFVATTGQRRRRVTVLFGCGVQNRINGVQQSPASSRLTPHDSTSSSGRW